MKAGDKVVCINDAWSDDTRKRRKVLPKKGVVYSVQELVPVVNECGMPLGRMGLLLVGFELIMHSGGVPWSFKADRFRPVSEVGHPPIEVEQPVPMLAEKEAK